MSKFYLTAAIPYINAAPHLGHVLEWFQADTIARYRRLKGDEVAFACGTDENSLKNVRAAEKAGLSAQEWLDSYADQFKEAFNFFNISLTHFVRSSDKTKHYPGVTDLWLRCNKNGDIYQKEYEGLYCVGCEAYYTPDELIEGKCPEHLTIPESIKETNYFFRLSKYQDQIRQLINSDQLKIRSEQYKKEMLGFIDQGLDDFSISRSKARAGEVGVEVPGDEAQVMYVWFDALSVYLTALSFGQDDKTDFDKFWPADLHVIGKGINRFHSVYWIGMLLSANLPLPKGINVHGYITADGQKMSKSLGNVIDPFAITKKYGLENIRYYLLKAIPTFSDGDFSEENFKTIYTADLSNGIGNLVSRVAAMAAKNNLSKPLDDVELSKEYQQLMADYNLSDALENTMSLVKDADLFLSTSQPWTKSGDEQNEILMEAINKIRVIALQLSPFMPQTTEKITKIFEGKIEKTTPLFPRV